jgi:hypothetical protein
MVAYDHDMYIIKRDDEVVGNGNMYVYVPAMYQSRIVPLMENPGRQFDIEGMRGAESMHIPD